jgi:hypothetical protein
MFQAGTEGVYALERGFARGLIRQAGGRAAAQMHRFIFHRQAAEKYPEPPRAVVRRPA